jgi:DNA-binding GntR family transcriptional regulator
VTERYDDRFAVVGNHLAQHSDLSLTVHIQSLPAGTPVGKKALATKFPEGEIRITAALRELEAHGYLDASRQSGCSRRG